MKKKLFALTFLVMLILILSVPSAYAWTTTPPQKADKSEVPTELMEKEYLTDVEQFYESHPDLVIIVDLADPKGIDPSLLPEDLKALGKSGIRSGVRIVAYRKTIHVDIASGKPNGLAMPCLLPKAGIGCAMISGSRDITTSQVFGAAVEEFARTVALRYDWYPLCQGGVNCFGWEVEKQYMWWKRFSSSWNVKNGVMKTYIEAENYCTQSTTTLNYGSSIVSQPTWIGNQTSKYLISGFPNTAYVPWPSGYSYTQGDIYRGTTLKYNDARVYQLWPMH